MLDKLIEIRTDLTIKDEFLVEVYEALDFENLDSKFVKGMRHGLIHSLILIDDLIQNLEE